MQQSLPGSSLERDLYESNSRPGKKSACDTHSPKPGPFYQWWPVGDEPDSTEEDTDSNSENNKTPDETRKPECGQEKLDHLRQHGTVKF